ncbi:MAG: heat-inducible transcriptional repressor HrcA [Eubacteriales bacterium]|nr:heat-inducible transcriptional repressor HrcA [Eubacteriales bacterium]
MPLTLDDRKKMILKAVVDDYIATAEPVGSKSLVSRHQLPVSSATIRNEMAELEELGYLEQPHTSAGRVPSDKGYRTYVDELMEVETLPDDEARIIQDVLRANMAEVTGLIRSASSLLSEQTQYASLALSPKCCKNHLQQIKMLMIEPGRALVVVVLSAGLVKDRMVRIPEMLDSAQLMQIASAIEEGLQGMTLDDITLVAVSAAGKHTPLPDSLLNQVLYEAYVSIKQADNLEVYMAGSNKLLAYPEFADVARAKIALDTLAKEGMVAGYLSETREEADDSTYMIRIGQEIALAGLENCSFVTTTYKFGDTVAGRIGVIGPRRMSYAKVISNINFVRMNLNDQIRRLGAGID